MKIGSSQLVLARAWCIRECMYFKSSMKVFSSNENASCYCDGSKNLALLSTKVDAKSAASTALEFRIASRSGTLFAIENTGDAGFVAAITRSRVSVFLLHATAGASHHANVSIKCFCPRFFRILLRLIWCCRTWFPTQFTCKDWLTPLCEV